MPTGISGDASTLAVTATNAPTTAIGTVVIACDATRSNRVIPSAASHRSLATWLAKCRVRVCAIATPPANAATSAHSASAVTMTSMPDSIFRSISDAGVISSVVESANISRSASVTSLASAAPPWSRSENPPG